MVAFPYMVSNPWRLEAFYNKMELFSWPVEKGLPSFVLIENEEEEEEREETIALFSLLCKTKDRLGRRENIQSNQLLSLEPHFHSWLLCSIVVSCLV